MGLSGLGNRPQRERDSRQKLRPSTPRTPLEAQALKLLRDTEDPEAMVALWECCALLAQTTAEECVETLEEARWTILAARLIEERGIPNRLLEAGRVLLAACPQDEAEEALLECWRAGDLDIFEARDPQYGVRKEHQRTYVVAQCDDGKVEASTRVQAIKALRDKLREQGGDTDAEGP